MMTVDGLFAVTARETAVNQVWSNTPVLVKISGIFDLFKTLTSKVSTWNLSGKHLELYKISSEVRSLI